MADSWAGRELELGRVGTERVELARFDAALAGVGLSAGLCGGFSVKDGVLAVKKYPSSKS